MIYTIDPSVDDPIMLINKHIGYDSDEGMGVDGSLFQMELLQLDTMGKKRIQIWINSPGGVVTDGYSIYSAILKSKTPVDTYCVGAAASIAGVIFQAGRKRIMADYSWLMYHNPFGGSNDDALKTFRESIVTMIEKRCGMDESAVGAMMNRTTFILADEAMAMKLCDEIDCSVEMNTKYLRKITDSVEFYKESNKVLNSILNKQNTNTMSYTKVTMKLKLNDAAREDDIVAEIEKMENRLTEADDKIALAESKMNDAIREVDNKAKVSKREMDKMKADMEEMENALKAKKTEYEDCKAKLDAMEADKKKAEDNASEEKAKNMIEGFAEAGRIKNEETIKLEWLDTAKLIGFDKTKNMIEALPLNKVSTNIQTEAVKTDLKAGELPTTSIGLAVRNKLIREGKKVA